MKGCTHIDCCPVFKPGSQPPKDTGDYLAWHMWADVQVKAGLRQHICGNCGLWKFPQELSGKWLSMAANTRKDGRGQGVTLASPVCKACAKKFPKLGKRGKPAHALVRDDREGWDK